MLTFDRRMGCGRGVGLEGRIDDQVRHNEVATESGCCRCCIYEVEEEGANGGEDWADFHRCCARRANIARQT